MVSVELGLESLVSSGDFGAVILSDAMSLSAGWDVSRVTLQASPDC